MTEDTEKTPASNEATRIFSPRIIVFSVGVLVLLALSFLLPVREYLVQLMNVLQSIGPYGLLALAILYVLACVLMVPGSILTLGAGFLAAAAWPDNFPVALLLATIAVSAGSVTGATAAFLLGRSLARDWIEKRVANKPTFRALDEAIARQGLKMVFLVRLSPAFPFNILNYALGLTRVRLRDYILGSWIGMLPGTIMYVYLGMGVQSVTALTTAGSDQDNTWKFALQILGLVATIAVVILVTRVARKAFNEALAANENKDETNT